MSDPRTRAAIRRASQLARNAMQQLDARTTAELVEIYVEAADQLRAAIRAAATAGDMVPQQHLQQLLAQLERIVQDLAMQRDALLLRGIEEAATLGVRPYTLQGVVATGMEGQALLTSAAAARVNEEAVQFVRAFQAADGLTLSDRLWRIDTGARETLGRAITSAVVQGWDASRAAAEAIYRGVPVPADVAGRLAGAQVGQLVRVADLLVGNSTDPAVPLANAQRVLRTEINRAHGEAYMGGGEGSPGFAGWRFLLSPMHPRPDICDLYARQNLHGLGAGVYPTRKACPWPAHPNTISFVVMVFAEEVTDEARAGRETALQALQRMGPEMRAGVLGQTKAAYFDQGLIGTGMVRSTLRAVEQRLMRRGDVHPQALPVAVAATIPPAKLSDYVLNPEHPRGGHKARVMQAVLGFGPGDGPQLAARIMEALPRHAARETAADQYGRRWTVDLPLTGPGGSGMVRTGWIQRPGERAPQLTSAYVKPKKPTP